MEARSRQTLEASLQWTYLNGRPSESTSHSGPHPEGDHDNTSLKLGVSPSDKIRMYHYGTNLTLKLHAKSFQMLRD